MDVDFDIVDVTDANLLGKLVGLFKKALSEEIEPGLEKFGCEQIDRAIAKANEKFCSLLDC